MPGQASAWLHSEPATSRPPSAGRRSVSACWTRSATPTTSQTSTSSRSPRTRRPVGSTRPDSWRWRTRLWWSRFRFTIDYTGRQCSSSSTRRKPSGPEPLRPPARRKPESRRTSLRRAFATRARSSFSAAAAEATGDSEAAQAYELRAQEIAPEGYDAMLAAPRARLALLRGEIDDVDSLIGPVDLGGRRIRVELHRAAVRLDLLAAARRRHAADA